jgi:CheY-like chemotaxis protein
MMGLEAQAYRNDLDGAALMARILVVEDEAIPRLVLNKILTGRGYEVRTAETAQDGIETGFQFHPDVLLVDWLLSEGQTGIHVVDALRKRFPDLLVLFFTGLPPEKLTLETQHLGPHRFLQKPCDVNELLEAIHEALRPCVQAGD